MTYLPVNSQGLIDVDQLESEIRPDTALVSVMAINNEIGESHACCRLQSNAAAQAWDSDDD